MAQKRLKGKTVSYKREEEIIGVIKDLTNKGLSQRSLSYFDIYENSNEE